MICSILQYFNFINCWFRRSS